MNIRSADGPLATLPEILDRRELRARQQMALLQQGPCVVSFSMNIPGARKAFPLAAAGFEEGLAQIRTILPPNCEITCLRNGGTAGEEALLLLDADPREIKRSMIELEQSHPLGRLWDIDVLGPDGRSLSRSQFGYPRRACLLCGQDAKICGRSRAHTHEELFWQAARMLDAFFREQAAEDAARCVARAMAEEVSATPKPGLVDRANTGAHRDMDFSLFLTSIHALEPFFAAFFRIGWDNGELPYPACFRLLRRAGLQAEQAMFAATGGVNTHKGMVFSAAILCGALGRLQAGLKPVPLPQLQEECARLGRCSLSDFESIPCSTAGLRCYREQQISGIRGEAAAGFPAAAMALQALQEWLALGACRNDAALYALLHLIARVEDTNMIHRGGADEAARRREQARNLLPLLTPETIVPQLEELDRAYIAANLSPGGCADLLSLAVALDLLEECGLLSRR